ncbi:hypothetical protein J6590_023909 [Homalodisca vitripennis]|nr:hypothetical protein J6590_023909 [Homalodisca vitripennis]
MERLFKTSFDSSGFPHRQQGGDRYPILNDLRYQNRLCEERIGERNLNLKVSLSIFQQVNVPNLSRPSVNISHENENLKPVRNERLFKTSFDSSGFPHPAGRMERLFKTSFDSSGFPHRQQGGNRYPILNDLRYQNRLCEEKMESVI